MTNDGNKYTASNGELEFEMSYQKLQLFGAVTSEAYKEGNTTKTIVKTLEFELQNKDNDFLNSIQTLLKNDATEYRNLILSQTKVKELFISLVSLNETITKSDNQFLAENTKTKDKSEYSELDYIISNYSNILDSNRSIYKRNHHILLQLIFKKIIKQTNVKMSIEVLL